MNFRFAGNDREFASNGSANRFGPFPSIYIVF